MALAIDFRTTPISLVELRYAIQGRCGPDLLGQPEAPGPPGRVTDAKHPNPTYRKMKYCCALSQQTFELS